MTRKRRPITEHERKHPDVSLPGMVEFHEEPYFEGELVRQCVVCGDDIEPARPGDPPTCGQVCWAELKEMSERGFDERCDSQ